MTPPVQVAPEASQAARAVEDTPETLRLALVRGYGEPWFRARQPRAEQVAAALVALGPKEPAQRAALIERWCAERLPRLDAWLAQLTRA